MIMTSSYLVSFGPNDAEMIVGDAGSDDEDDDDAILELDDEKRVSLSHFG